MKLITSSPHGHLHPSWSAFDAVNIVNDGESGDVQISLETERLFPGKYGPPIYSAIQAADGPAVLVNSDIRLNLSPKQVRALLDRFELTIAQRIETPAGKLNPWGIDVFVFDDRFRARMLALPGWEKLQFGAPWWDYVLPLAALQSGVDVGVVNSPVAFHHTHEQRWDAMAQRWAGEYSRRFLTSVGFRPDGDLARESCTAIKARATPVVVHQSMVEELAWRFATQPDPTPAPASAPEPSLGRRAERAARPYVHAVRPYVHAVRRFLVQR